MNKDLVFEIGTEELPSSCILEGVEGLKDILIRKLKQERVSFLQVDTLGTPRRLTAIVKGIDEMQNSQQRVITGPPKKIAFEADGTPTQAAIGFARSLGLKADELEEIDTERGIYLGKTVQEEGKPVLEVLPDLLKQAITDISFSKQMYWGDYSLKFARPIRWILALWGDKVVDFEIENLKSGRLTYGLRTIPDNPLAVENADCYLDLIASKGMIMINPDHRCQKILDSLSWMEQNQWGGKYQVVMDHELLAEVVNLVEFPHVLAGKFSDHFLYIPQDILIKAIEYHQRYFAVIDEKGQVTNNFLVVQNGTDDNSGDIIKGNQRVLEARLSDAAFFYEEDKKHGFDQWLEKLKGVIFYSGLGSMHDKVNRLEKLAQYLSMELGQSHIKDDACRAARLCKCDLVTNMVVEFPELQGVVGREYALEKGENSKVANAIFEHYLPRFAEDILPESETGAVLSIADKIDTTCGMFLLDNIPTGSEDPFALRRKASGIVSSILDRKYDLDLNQLIEFNLNLYLDTFDIEKPSHIVEKILDFMLARYRFRLEKEGKRLDIMEAVAATGVFSVVDMDNRYRALQKFIEEQHIELIANPMIRCQNIIKGGQAGQIAAGLLKEEGERQLYLSIQDMEDKFLGLKKEKDYFSMLEELKNFGRAVDNFFDQVLVMDQDEDIKNNRISLVKSARDLYLNVADFSKLVMEG